MTLTRPPQKIDQAKIDRAKRASGWTTGELALVLEQAAGIDEAARQLGHCVNMGGSSAGRLLLDLAQHTKSLEDVRRALR